MQQNTINANKRQRLTLQTPGGPLPQAMGLTTPASSMLLPSGYDRLSSLPSGDGLMDYLRGRGGKIKELEDELVQARGRCEKLQQELNLNNEKVALLTAENKALKAAASSSSAVSAPGGTSSALQLLHQQLDEQLHRALLLEQDLATAKQREAVSTQRLASLESLLAEQRAEQAKLLAETEAAAAHLRMEVEAARAEAKTAVQKAELAERAAGRRVEAEREILRVAQAQLEAMRGQAAGLKAELEQSRQRAARCEAEAEALRGNATRVRLQLMEEELRSARGAEAESRSAAAAAAAAAPPPLQQQQPAFGRLPPLGSGKDPRPCAPAERRVGTSAGGSISVSSGSDLETGELSEPLRPPWAALLRMLGVPGGLPLLSQAAEAGRAAAALAEETADLRAAVKAQDESLMQLRAAASGSEAYAAELQSQLAELRGRLERALTAERVAERRAAAIEAERDALRAALSPGATGSGAGSGRAAGAAEAPHPASLSGRLLAGQQAAMVEQLAQLNEGLQKQMAALQQEIAASASAAEAQALAARAATSRADAAEQRVRQLEKEADALAGEVAALQERLGRGELIRAGGVRVLHLRHNPEAEARQATREATVTRLGAENEALRAQVAALEGALQALRDAEAAQANAAGPAAAAAGATPGSGGPHQPVGPGEQPQPATTAAATAVAGALSPPALGSGVAIAVKDAEITVLRRKVEEGEKAMSRLKHVFKERITVFREACYSLFGYRVDMTAEATAVVDAAGAPTTFTLKPQHADDPAALLVFRCTGGGGGSGGRMELVPNSYTRERLSREVETFVRKFNCIPALTANLTMENFQKQTQC